MKTRLLSALGLVIIMAMLASPQVAFANTRFGDGGDLPLYARLERSGIFGDGQWVAVVFYRPPECIPVTFNLLDLFDFENAWFCGPPTTDGFFVFKDPAVNPTPMQQVLHGRGAVPVWFVSHAEYVGAIADDTLTIGELASLPSRRIGYASFFHETLHPYGGSQMSHLEYDAHGVLEDGTSFHVHVAATEARFDVNIKFGG